MSKKKIKPEDIPSHIARVEYTGITWQTLQYYLGTGLLCKTKNGRILMLISFDSTHKTGHPSHAILKNIDGEFSNIPIVDLTPILTTKLSKKNKIHYKSMLDIRQGKEKKLHNAIRFLHKKHFDVRGIVHKKLAIQKTKKHTITL